VASLLPPHERIFRLDKEESNFFFIRSATSPIKTTPQRSLIKVAFFCFFGKNWYTAQVSFG
jgi:hypothetical protein